MKKAKKNLESDLQDAKNSIEKLNLEVQSQSQMIQEKEFQQSQVESKDFTEILDDKPIPAKKKSISVQVNLVPMEQPENQETISLLQPVSSGEKDLCLQVTISQLTEKMNNLMDENSNLREQISKLKDKLSENSDFEQSSFMKESDYLNTIHEKDSQITLLKSNIEKLKIELQESSLLLEESNNETLLLTDSLEIADSITQKQYSDISQLHQQRDELIHLVQKFVPFLDMWEHMNKTSQIINENSQSSTTSQPTIQTVQHSQEVQIPNFSLFPNSLSDLLFQHSLRK